MAPGDDEIAALLTARDQAKAVICERAKCPTKRFPPGTDTYFVHAQNPNAQGEGIWVCGDCWVYYQNKVGTISRSSKLWNKARI